jgi:hypothetical protein
MLLVNGLKLKLILIFRISFLITEPINIYNHMKFIITESKLDSIIFEYLDNQDFVIIKIQNRLYYVNSEDDEYAQIRYHPKDRWCTIHFHLADEVSEFFSLEYFDSISVINRWIENKLGIKSINVEVASPIVGY